MINSKKNIKPLLPLLFIAILMISGSCQNNSRIRILKLGHGLDTEHPVHKGMVYMSELIETRSGGKMKVQIYPSQQLGSERQCVELLQIGSLAMTKVSASVMEGFAPDYKVLSLPFIFDNREHSYRVLDGEVGNEILLSSEKYWLRGLTFYDAGSRSFYTIDKPILHPDDLIGLKIRVMKSPTAMDMVESFGGNPTPISWGELYTSLQTGRVDAAENNPPSFRHSFHYEVCKYYSLDEHTTIPDVLLISTIIWNQLSDQEKEWLQEAADESARYQRVLWQEDEIKSYMMVKEKGVTIIPNKEIDIESFKVSVEPMYREAEKNSRIKDLINRIKSEV